MDASSYHSGTASHQFKTEPPIDLPPLHLSNNPINEPSATPTVNPNTDRRKRSHSDKQAIVTGRSFKRLRLDHATVTVPSGRHLRLSTSSPGNPFDGASIGTLSVGTMGGDLESNDEDDYEEEEEMMSDSQSWVASLPSLSSRRRMPSVAGAAGGLNGACLNSGIGAGLKSEEGDDAATCAEMTTAAVAPRRRARHRAKKKERSADGASSPLLLNGEKKRRAIGFAIDSGPAESRAFKDDLVVEEIELDSMFVVQKPEAVGQSQSFENNVNGTQNSMSSPPVECIPDPLLVAAQHAAGGGNDESNQNMDDNGAALFVGDCYSSVTEEETSLAEDEASLSAVSLGGNTTTSVGGTTMASSKEGAAPGCLTGENDLRGVRRTNSQGTADSMEMKAPPSFDEKQHNVNNAMQHHEKATDYNSLNSLLGRLHQERQQRNSIQQSSPHRRGSSYHSLGSMGVHSNISGNSHLSLPNYPMNCADAPSACSWRIQHETSTPVQMDHTLTGGDMDVDMEGVAESSSLLGGQSNSANASQCGDEKRGASASNSGVPKWKQRVKLPSHSSLY